MEAIASIFSAVLNSRMQFPAMARPVFAIRGMCCRLFFHPFEKSYEVDKVFYGACFVRACFLYAMYTG